MGKTFTPVPGQELPREDLRLAAIAVGKRHSDLWHFQRGEVDIYGKIDPKREVDYYDLKGALEIVLEAFEVNEATFVPSNISFLYRGTSADVVLDGKTIGFLGELAPKKARDLELTEGIQIFEILLEPLFIQRRKKRVFRPVPRYPYIERDLSLMVETNCSGDDIKHLISRLGHDIITSVILFDLYRGETIPEGSQSMAFRIRYQSENRTLTDDEVQEVHSSVVDSLVREFGATMRE
jgi:phenylalanyl-tRNA synthetase beta chain